jgi:hypothetical protein
MVLYADLKERYHLVDIGEDGRRVIEWILGKMELCVDGRITLELILWWVVADWIHLAQDREQ